MVENGRKEKRGGRERNEWSEQQFFKFFVLLDFISKKGKNVILFAMSFFKIKETKLKKIKLEERYLVKSNFLQGY